MPAGIPEPATDNVANPIKFAFEVFLKSLVIEGWFGVLISSKSRAHDFENAFLSNLVVELYEVLLGCLADFIKIRVSLNFGFSVGIFVMDFHLEPGWVEVFFEDR